MLDITYTNDQLINYFTEALDVLEDLKQEGNYKRILGKLNRREELNIEDKQIISLLNEDIELYLQYR